MLKTDVRERDDIVIADLSGRLTLDVGDSVLHELVDDLLAAGHEKLVLNLAGVTYIDSSGLGELVGALRVTRAMNRSLKILSPAGQVYDTLSVARLLPLFEVFQDEDEVVASFARLPSGAGVEDDPEVLYEVDGRVAKITLNRPRKFNALSRTMLSELVSQLAAARRDRQVRVIVLTGAGRAFCFGADAEELREGEGAMPTLELLQTVIQDLHDTPKPIVAAINGFATGAGLDLALACDLRVMSEKAKLASAFVRFGLVPDGGSTHVLPRLIGSARAAEMVFSGRTVDANEALSWGLVNRVVSSKEVLGEAMAWAGELAVGPVRAIGRAKRLLAVNPCGSLRDALTAEAGEQAIAFEDPEFREGLHAHLEKRDPCFPD